ncbi:MAG TPA: pyridoxamine 5'-phosphate oxidase family protein [Byssovorax sp.]
MDRQGLIRFLQSQKLAVLGTVAADGSPQGAVVGIATSDAGEVVFDTLTSTRKARNLRERPRGSITAWQGDVTVQLEGVADEPAGDERARLLDVYFGPYPDGKDRLAWTGITHFRVRPTWARYTDFGATPPVEVEIEWPAD